MSADKKIQGDAGDNNCPACEVLGDYMSCGNPNGQPDEDISKTQGKGFKRFGHKQAASKKK